VHSPGPANSCSRYEHGYRHVVARPEPGFEYRTNDFRTEIWNATRSLVGVPLYMYVYSSTGIVLQVWYETFRDMLMT
jgi:hypothetical protein